MNLFSLSRMHSDKKKRSSLLSNYVYAYVCAMTAYVYLAIPQLTEGRYYSSWGTPTRMSKLARLWWALLANMNCVRI